jgi:BirA family biotin operon repressor/biotin-[acetyl-CoA-carboxylase] ligase
MPPETSPFNLAEINDAIAGTEFHGHVLYFESVESTMNLASEAAQSGARHGVWIADEQTAGRGRGSHTWHSAPGDGLYMTALTAPPIPMLSALRLTFRIAIAVQAAIAAIAGFRIRDEIDIRWPNDLILKGRKCGGILIDTVSQSAEPPNPAMLRYATIGIGINLNHLAFPPELEPVATSLRRELPEKPTLRREPLAAAILNNLDREIRALTSDNERRTTDDLDRYSSWLTGKRVRIEPREGTPNTASYTGTTAGLDSQGFLRVVADDGDLRTVLNGGLREL